MSYIYIVHLDPLEDPDASSLEVERFACPECSADFAGKVFLEIHIRKVHPNLRLIIQTPRRAKQAPSVPPIAPKKKSTQGCQTKEEDSERFYSPEIVKQIVKYTGSANKKVKHLALNGYEFKVTRTRGDVTYWICKSNKICSSSIAEYTAEGSFKRGTLGWAMDGLTHISHPPDFQK